MKKKIILPLLIIVAIAQFFVPAYMIRDKYDVLANGQEVKIKVRPIDPYDAFRGRYVSLGYDYDIDYSQRDGKYGILEVDSDGFAKLGYVSSRKPTEGLYLVSEDDDYFIMPFDRYYMEETLAPEAEKAINGEAEAYITVRIKGDKSVISGLYIKNVPAEELLQKK